MDVTYFQRGSSRIWQHVEPGFIALAVWTERVPGHGEDADPLVLHRRSTGRGILSVFDGVGGAGRGSAGRTTAGVDRTQAWVASRRVRGLVEDWFVRGLQAGALGEHIAARLAGPVTRRSRMRGSMHRDYPTTIACLDYTCAATEVCWEVLWAGDSRCYVADPVAGLQQLSRDDTHSADALELLVQDPPMTNMVSDDRPFALNRWRGHADLPCVLVCATDGFFGYVDTPAEFEHLLWQTLTSAQDIRHWGALLAARVGSYSKDDASLALVALGFADLADLRVRFLPRAREVERVHVRPMRYVPPGNHPALVEAREQSWRGYRHGYERRLLIDGETR